MGRCGIEDIKNKWLSFLYPLVKVARGLRTDSKVYKENAVIGTRYYFCIVFYLS